jgi:osmotically-inducible protein OsmY
MPSKIPVKDDVLILKVNQQLMKRGIRVPCRVNVAAHRGTVTLTGHLQYDVQRKMALRAAREVPGVEKVVDEMEVTPPTAAWGHK